MDFLKKILVDTYRFFRPLHPCFELLVTTRLGFEARVGNLIRTSVADPGFPQVEGTNPRGGGGRGGGHQHTILPNFPQNCMKLKEFGPGGVQNFTL